MNYGQFPSQFSHTPERISAYFYRKKSYFKKRVERELDSSPVPFLTENAES